MTRTIFTKVFNAISENIKNTVNGELCMNYSCELTDYCGGHELIIKPDCIIWGDELDLMSAIARANQCSMQITLYNGTIRIY